MRPTSSLLATALLSAALAVTTLALAQADDDDDDQDATLGRVVKEAPVTLQQGFAASSREGTPISGKFEIEVDGAQLSVYTTKGGGFSEVIVDHRTGRIAKVIAITEGNDLVHARQQMTLMKDAGRSLEQLTQQALSGHPGFSAVSATPALREQPGYGGAVVKIVLTNGTEWQTVYEGLGKGSE